ncbi:MAG: DUF3536 domain-containing protein [Candidatus Omnitrophica bacterium]|nr:DUF3536 domain-containing protein [Candidatus Omnitrophota bacterium]MCM8826149.1 DUF3536 domain-containing protein [Candidatus Omnitrophota bacterium]
MNHFVCIHAHCYQPPRENPWLEEVEQEPSAYPYHDWNERVTAESYAPNTASRRLDGDNWIIDIVNLYSKISFNFGPTLMFWLEKHRPKVYQAIISADKESRKNFSGHGSAIAQAYNHMIMPLANSRDKLTQVIWGIKDFEFRFGRKPEGMWLPETAVDRETLEILATQGIKFTILSPFQAKWIKRIGSTQWIDVRGGKIDTKRPYIYSLPSGKRIIIFFYCGEISNDIAFGRLLDRGEEFAKRLSSLFDRQNNEPQICNVANDGETYGHHRKHGDMALNYCLYYLMTNKLAQITVYGEYLERFPPTYEVEIIENTSWSCVHGVERWRDDCGCNSGMHLGWKQSWRKNLREAMDWLRDKLIPIYEKSMSGYVVDPWALRNEYITVILNRDRDNVERFFKKYIKKKLSYEEKNKILSLLEMQRCSMLMYTSCGWFFDDISGIETIQIMHYANRAMYLCYRTTGISLHDDYLRLLKSAKSNISGLKDGVSIYEIFVKPAIVNLLNVGVHYAVSSLFNHYPSTTKLFSYRVNRYSYEKIEDRKNKFACGRVLIRSDITWEEEIISFAVVHLGGHNLLAGVTESSKIKDFNRMRDDLKNRFIRGEYEETIKLINKYFSSNTYSLWHLFCDERNRIINVIFEEAIQDIEVTFNKLYNDYHILAQVAKNSGVNIPEIFMSIIDFVYNHKVYNFLKKGEFNVENLMQIINEFKNWSLILDRTKLNILMGKIIEELMEDFIKDPNGISILDRVLNVVEVGNILSLDFSLWEAQNMYFHIANKLISRKKENLHKNDRESKLWLDKFLRLGKYLRVKIDR